MHNVFADNEDRIVNALGGQGGGLSSDLLKKALPMLAPLAMAILAKSFSRGGGAAQAGAGGGGGLGDVLGGLLGGGKR